MTALITRVDAWEALDSRGNPTVACAVEVAGGQGQAVVPSGASTGAHEAVELRDGGDRYGGKGVLGAVANVQTVLAEAVTGIDADDQHAVDEALRAADPTPGFGQVGANAVLAVSLAACLAAADAERVPLYRWLAAGSAGATPLLPLPMVNILSGGAHAGGAIDVQDFLVVPVGADSFAQAVEWAWRVRRAAADLMDAAGHGTALVADEGGLAAPFASNRAALELLTQAIERSGLAPGSDAAVAIDVAATQLVDGDRYALASEGRSLGADEWVAELADWCARFPIVSIEDPLGEDDWTGWATATKALGHVQVLGDDLFVTNTERLARGVEEGIANAVLVKPNQTGTVSGARRVVDLAQRSGYATVLSARSGETEDAWLADMAVGWRTGQIKVGSVMRSERTAKWNRLLRIEAELDRAGGSDYAGRGALEPAIRLGAPGAP
ncbi:MAG: enolase [Acidimicrobiaceae bacterium]|nr:enolase [Acidimicrobiaceae bacterium]